MGKTIRNMAAVLACACLTLAVLPASAWADEVAQTSTSEAGTSDSYAVTPATADVASIGSNGYASLKDAFAAVTDGQTIKVLNDITVTETVSSSKTCTLDLNGHTITGSQARVLNVTAGTLTLDGTGTLKTTGPAKGTDFDNTKSVIRVSGNAGAAGLVVGKDVTVSSDFCYGISVFSNGTAGADVALTLDVYGTVSTSGPTVGNNTPSAIAGVGRNTNKTITIHDGATVSATYDVAIYHPENGTLNIEGGTINGGIESKAGTVNITGGTINARSVTASHTSNNDGSSTKGYALAIVENPGYSTSTTSGSTVAANISGGTINGDVILAWDRTAKPGETNSTGNISITGGNVNGSLAKEAYANGSLLVKGGLFTVDPSTYVDHGYAAVGTSKSIDGITYDYAIDVTSAPAITTQPTDATATEGDTATFSVVATGVPAPTYQWQISLDDGKTWSDVDEATASSYTTPELVTSNSGVVYRCIVTNELGKVTSSSATLTVTAKQTTTDQTTTPTQTTAEKTPQTGDTSASGLGLLLVSGGLFSVAVLVRKRMTA